jgi:hypothetical protein
MNFIRVLLRSNILKIQGNLSDQAVGAVMCGRMNSVDKRFFVQNIYTQQSDNAQDACPALDWQGDKLVLKIWTWPYFGHAGR